MKKLLALLLSFVMLFSLVACGDDEEYEDEQEQEQEEQYEEDVEEDVEEKVMAEAPIKDTDTKWAIYWYLCGSDLESGGGAATTDLQELLQVELPENVQIVIQTGGAAMWQNELVDPNMAQRYVYDCNGFNLVEEFEAVNMGDAQTLSDFLSFANENYPAQHTMVNFWNHGGGSVAGAAFDEQFGGDSLTLPELYQAFDSVFESNYDYPPVDIIGFDTCLMATVDVANYFSDFASYLVASQELEPGNGWYYTGIANTLANNLEIEPLDFAKAICDTYVEGCEYVGTQDSITLSVTNLKNTGKLMAAYNEFGREALAAAIEDPSFLTKFYKAATKSENYGGNTRDQGYTNMVDLGHLAEQNMDILPESASAVLEALENCIEYRIDSVYRAQGHGLSCFYSYDGDLDLFNQFANLGTSEAFRYLYEYGLTGQMSEEGMAYIAEMNYDEVPEITTISDTSWEDMPLTINDEGCATLSLGEDAQTILASLSFELYYMDPNGELMICLGTDNDITGDWDRGVFSENFRGVWGSIDGCLCYMELAFEGDDYNEYAVPIMLNGEKYNLSVVYDFNTEEFYILGARKPLSEDGAADKNLVSLQEGDEIQTIHYITDANSDTEEFTEITVDTITVTPEISFKEAPIGDGYFFMMFAMEDCQGNVSYSSVATFECIDGEIYTTVD